MAFFWCLHAHRPFLRLGHAAVSKCGPGEWVWDRSDVRVGHRLECGVVGLQRSEDGISTAGMERQEGGGRGVVDGVSLERVSRLGQTVDNRPET